MQMRRGEKVLTNVDTSLGPPNIKIGLSMSKKNIIKGPHDDLKIRSTLTKYGAEMTFWLFQSPDQRGFR